MLGVRREIGSKIASSKIFLWLFELIVNYLDLISRISQYFLSRFNSIFDFHFFLVSFSFSFFISLPIQNIRAMMIMKMAFVKESMNKFFTFSKNLNWKYFRSVLWEPIDILDLKVFSFYPRRTEPNEGTPIINSSSPILAPQEGQHPCDCGGVKISQEEAQLRSAKSLSAEKNHVCKLSCPWILEGCLFIGPKELFANHFKLHCSFDSQVSARKPQTFDPNSEQQRPNTTKETGADKPPSVEVRACELWDRGVQGCLYKVSEMQLQSHLESKEFLSLHMNFILD